MSLASLTDPKEREIKRLRAHVQELQDKVTALEVELALVREPRGSTDDWGTVSKWGGMGSFMTASAVLSAHTFVASPGGLRPYQM